MRNLEKIKDEIDRLILYGEGKGIVVAIYIFGSFGTEYENEFSDIDIGILYSSDLNLREELLIESDICKIFGRDDIDVINLNKAPIDLQFEVISKGELVYCKDDSLLTDFIERVLDIYQDYSFFLERFYQEMLDR